MSIIKNAIIATAIFFILAVSNHASAGQFWSEDKTTNALIISANALALIDWRQTRYIAKNPDRFHERGIASHFIGEHPSTGDVDQYFALSIILTNGIGYFLPESATVFGLQFNPKKSFYIGANIYEGYYVLNNIELGIRIQH